jgi:hypothetical protein
MWTFIIHHAQHHINYQNHPNKTIALDSTIHVKTNMLIELCARNYSTFDGVVNGGNDIFKTSTTHCNKTLIWIKLIKLNNMS